MSEEIKNEEKKHSYGLVLSGGGIRGVAHIGAIKALTEYGINPSIISGTSAGAIVGAFYAGGYSCEDMLTFFHRTSIFSVYKYAYRKPGLIDTAKFYNIFKDFFPEDEFEALLKKLYISTTDIVHGKQNIFHEGQLINPILASSAYPGVFTPVSINDSLHADGGISNNFPIEPLISRCDKIIGVYANPLKKMTKGEFTSSLSVLERAFKIGMASMSEHKFESCSLIIYPEKLAQYRALRLNNIDELFNIGYEATIQALREQYGNISNASSVIIAEK